MALLVYDYREGYVINPETGEVVDVIIDYSPPLPRKRENTAAQTRRTGKTSRKHRKLRRLLERYRKLAAYEDQGYIIDYEKASTSKAVKTMKHERSLVAEEYFKEKGLINTLEEIIRKLDEKGYTSGMTIRGRLVLAYIIYMQTQGKQVDYQEVKPAITHTTFKRILRKLGEIQKHLNHNKPITI